MKKTTCCGTGAVILLSAAVSAVTALAVLVMHAWCVHSKSKPLRSCDEFCVSLDPTEES